MSAVIAGARADVDIQHDTMEELSWDPNVNVTDIGVSVKEGVVTLRGVVDSYYARMAAQNAALRVKGVHAVANDVEVRLHASAERTDSELALSALNVLYWDTAVPADKLAVTVSHGFVTLHGMVDWPFQREAAESAIRRLSGVKGITNSIAVAAHATPGDIKDRIERALVRSAEVDADKITVEVSGHTVTLTGVVRSFAEKASAERTALSAPGITTVINHIRLSYQC